MPELSKLKLSDGVAYDLKDVIARNAIRYDTTANWDAQPQLTAEQGVIYIYSDYEVDENNQLIAGIKIGDGTSYLIDMPFVNGTGSGASGGITVHLDSTDPENLVFSNNAYTPTIAQNGTTGVLSISG